MTGGLSLPGGTTTSRGWLPQFLNRSLSEISAAMASVRFWPSPALMRFDGAAAD
jgi:hypothetical protein